ncbi:DUF6734 family protein [Thiococcus pfennigii]|uniref:DUF6734 family protein n=1 Tax=Thiococcus pfennigii TaxID=1057 RepID=UPI001906EAB8|nr:DUF6734 family protein [Thiococcus pfennigii]MBK1702093.1 hypothetical protein [Thiococcus pfennigii]MBK1733162.1 hypothetical protein [Thiococcus pfennigii]
MRIVWSLWTRPLTAGGRIGWRSPKDHLLSWILSVGLARRHYLDTCLVTDDAGAALLVDGLGLEFGEVSLSLNALARHDPDWWALGKLYAYAEQSAPFLHIDSDVYLWEPLPEDLLAAPVIASHPEYPQLGRSCYRPDVLERDLRAGGGYIPPELQGYLPIDGVLRAENCGIFGGHRLDFIRHYAETAKTLVHHPRNQPIWAARAENYSDAIIFEQLLLSACLSYHQGRDGSPWSDIAIRYLFDSYEDAAANAAHRGFTHLIAGAKWDASVVAGLERCVERQFPEHYARALEIAARAVA